MERCENDVCGLDKYKQVVQLHDKDKNSKEYPIFPITYTHAVYDKSGANLESMLAQFNNVFLQYQGTAKDTRLLLPKDMRRKGVQITYRNMNDEVVTEKCVNDSQRDNEHWGLDTNWMRIDELSLQGDISVSKSGTWIINGADTGVKALGPKGDNGLTPWMKTIDNKLYYSYDNQTWELASDYIAAWFRFTGTSGSSQAGNVGKIQISRDEGKTWADLSGTFTNNLHIKGYVATTSDLPSSAVQGDIYGVGPTYAESDTEHTNPIYKLFVKNENVWVDNGQFTSIAAGVVQELGESETEVISQKFLSNNSFLNRKFINSNIDINDITDIGIYVWISESYPKNIPDEKSGMLIVFPYYHSNAEIQSMIKNTQMVIMSNNDTYIRHSNLEVGYLPWSKLAKDEKFAETLYNRVMLSSTDDLNEYTSVGVYSWDSTNTPLNSPMQGIGQCIILPFKYGNNVSQVFQYVYGINSMFFRYKASDGWGPWNNVYMTNIEGETKETNTLANKIVVPANDDLDNYLDTAIINWTTSTIPANSPFIGKGGICVVLPSHNANSSIKHGLAQLAISQTNELAIRYRTSFGWKDWTIYKNDIIIEGGGSGNSSEENKIRAFVNKCFTKWTPLNNIPTPTNNLDYYNGIISGLPYSSVFPYGQDILYNRNLSTFYSALENPASILYTKGYGGNTHTGSYYGVVCSSFVDYLCNQDIYWTTSELPEVLDKIDYIDIEQLNVGDILYGEGHCKIITKVFVDENSNYYITVTEQKQNETQELTYDKEGFDRILAGTDPHDSKPYKLGRFPNQGIRILPRIEYSNEIISEYGDRTYFSLNEDIFIYVTSGDSIIINNGSSNININLSSLPTKQVGDTIMYNIKEHLNNVGEYKLYLTQASIPAILKIINTGNVVLDGTTVNISGYSDNVKPVWWQTVTVKLKISTEYSTFPAPEGYMGTYTKMAKGFIDNNIFNITYDDTFEGYYVRCYYDTGYGFAYNDSNIVMLN